MKSAAAFIGVMVLVLAGSSQEITDADLERASGGRTVRLRLGANGGARIADVPLELYVARVLAGEGEPRAAAAAQQALAIAIRTFAVANAGRHRRDDFDLCDTTHCQVLRPSTPAARIAALATASQLLTYEGRPATVFYSASCGGKSEAASQVWAGATDLPYLASREDDAHDMSEAWTYEVPVAQVEKVLRRLGFEGRRLRGVDVERRSSSGRAIVLHLSGMRPDSIAGEDFRMALGPRDLRSTQFGVEKDGGVLRFSGRGYGHGVGLCVIGAGRRAARGESAAAILQQYYPGLSIQGASGIAARSSSTPTPVSVVNTASVSVEDHIAARVRDDLAKTLQIDPGPPFTVRIYESLDEFRRATGQPWWVSAAVDGRIISLPPGAILEQQRALETWIRRGVAEALVAEVLTERPVWVRVGAARYYAAPPASAPKKRVRCPSDAELILPVSAPAHRDAELRAEACFARALAKTRDWRRVR